MTSVPHQRALSGRRRARKRFGQHFLERAWVDKVVHVIAPHGDDLFLEIGPGQGALTRPLAARVKRVVAVEIDRDLVQELREARLANVTVLPGDVLDVSATDLVDRFGVTGASAGLRVTGNLPYNIATPILFKLVELFERGLPIRDATVMVQREVADRIVASPGTRDYGTLSVQLQHVAGVARVLTLPPGAFRPPPKVTSAVVRLRFHAPNPSVRDLDAMRALVRSLFTRRRKTILNALTGVLELPRSTAAEALGRAGIGANRRPESLVVAEFAQLSDVIQETRHASFVTTPREVC